MDSLLAIKSLEDTCKNLGIPEYVEGLTDEEIIIIALHKLESFVIKNRDILYDDIHEGEQDG